MADRFAAFNVTAPCRADGSAFVGWRYLQGCRPGRAPRTSPVTAALVPDFPRYMQTVRDFIAQDVPQLPGFNGNDINTIILPDLLNVANLYTAVLVLASAVAFFYWEGGQLLSDFRQEQDMERLEEEFREGQQGGQEAGAGRGVDAAELQRLGETPEQRAKWERRRGLGWLALVTLLALWCAGGLVGISAPFF